MSASRNNRKKAYKAYLKALIEHNDVKKDKYLNQATERNIMISQRPTPTVAAVLAHKHRGSENV